MPDGRDDDDYESAFKVMMIMKTRKRQASY